MLKAIKAHYEKDEKILQEVLNEVKIARAKRKKTKMSTARPRRKSKDKNSSIDGSDDNVDSTSGGLKVEINLVRILGPRCIVCSKGFFCIDMQDLVPYNRYVNSNRGSDLDVDQNYLDRLYQRQHSAYMDSVSRYDARLSNQLQSNYMASSTAMLQYNGLQKVFLSVPLYIV